MDGYIPSSELIPLEWASVSFGTSSSCGVIGSDTVESLYFELLSVSTENATGSYSIKIIGGGPREGDTMEIEGAFDVEFEAI